MSSKKRVKKLHNLSELENLINQEKEKRQKETRPTISISSGTCGQARGSDKLTEVFKKAIRQQNLQATVILKIAGCHGFCEAEPNVVIYPKGFFYQKLKPWDAIEIINRTILKGKIIDEFLLLTHLARKKPSKRQKFPF